MVRLFACLMMPFTKCASFTPCARNLDFTLWTAFLWASGVGYGHCFSLKAISACTAFSLFSQSLLSFSSFFIVVGRPEFPNTSFLLSLLVFPVFLYSFSVGFSPLLQLLRVQPGLPWRQDPFGSACILFSFFLLPAKEKPNYPTYINILVMQEKRYRLHL